jgi:phospholipid transport system substrate-binding protein
MLCIALGLIAAAPIMATAGGATEALRPAVDRVLHILADPALKGGEHTPERRRALRAVMEGVLDFPDAARRALGVRWQGRTDAERDEFGALFKELVTYSDIVKMEAYAGQTVLFVGETANDDVVTVLTKIQSRQGSPVAIDYRTHQRAGRWLVYDVVVEGVSLVGNYRTQFNSIIRTSSYAELMRRMRVRSTS